MAQLSFEPPTVRRNRWFSTAIVRTLQIGAWGAAGFGDGEQLRVKLPALTRGSFLPGALRGSAAQHAHADHPRLRSHAHLWAQTLFLPAEHCLMG
jgi:hypothetical protein